MWAAVAEEYREIFERPSNWVALHPNGYKAGWHRAPFRWLASLLALQDIGREKDRRAKEKKRAKLRKTEYEYYSPIG